MKVESIVALTGCRKERTAITTLNKFKNFPAPNFTSCHVVKLTNIQKNSQTKFYVYTETITLLQSICSYILQF